MKRKLTLDVNSLEVTSFAAHATDAEPGTVHGREATGLTCPFTCNPGATCDCPITLGLTCDRRD